MESGFWLVIDKPCGISSTKLLNQIKAILRKSQLYPGNKSKIRIGHAGTLDPFASGAMLIAVGDALKLMKLAIHYDKSYIFDTHWGIETDTLDKDGNILETNDKVPSHDEIRSVIRNYIGTINQIPPKFSAIKLQGERAYNLARQNKDFSIDARKVQCHDIKIIKHSEKTTSFSLKCGSGFYVRSLARDIAKNLNCLGHVSYLRRDSIGSSKKLTNSKIFSLDIFEKMMYNASSEDIRYILNPVSFILDDILVCAVDLDISNRLSLGQRVNILSKDFLVFYLKDGICSKYHSNKIIYKDIIAIQSIEGNLFIEDRYLIAICDYDGHTLSPKRVFSLRKF